MLMSMACLIMAVLMLAQWRIAGTFDDDMASAFLFLFLVATGGAYHEWRCESRAKYLDEIRSMLQPDRENELNKTIGGWSHHDSMSIVCGVISGVEVCLAVLALPDALNGTPSSANLVLVLSVLVVALSGISARHEWREYAEQRRRDSPRTGWLHD